MWGWCSTTRTISTVAGVGVGPWAFGVGLVFDYAHFSNGGGGGGCCLGAVPKLSRARWMTCRCVLLRHRGTCLQDVLEAFWRALLGVSVVSESETVDFAGRPASAPLDEAVLLQDSRMVGVCPKEPSNPVGISVRKHSVLGFRHRICHFLNFECQASGFDDSVLIGDAKAHTNALWRRPGRGVHAKDHPGGPVGLNIERLQPAIAGDQAGTGYLKNLAYSKSRPSRWLDTRTHAPMLREAEISSPDWPSTGAPHAKAWAHSSRGRRWIQARSVAL